MANARDARAVNAVVVRELIAVASAAVYTRLYVSVDVASICVLKSANLPKE